MSLDAAALRKLGALGLTAEQMTGVLDVLASMTEAEDARKAAQRDRTRKFREKIRGVTLQSDYGNGYKARAGVTRVEDKPLPTEIEPQEGKKENARAALPSGFDEFWALFPNKVGKADASKAFAKASKLVDIATMLAALRRYVAKTDDRPWCNPATWLNQARWDDQPAVVVPMARAGPAQRPTLIDLIDQKMGVSHADPRPAQTAVLDLPAAAYGHR